MTIYLRRFARLTVKLGRPAAVLIVLLTFVSWDGAAESGPVMEVRTRAENGDAQAQWSMGVCYYYGTAAPKSYVAAAGWFQKAAEQGHSDAQHMLGFCYDLGNGVPEDRIEAYKWYLLAAAQRNDLARHGMATSEKYLSPAQIAEGQRLAANFIPRPDRRNQLPMAIQQVSSEVPSPASVTHRGGSNLRSDLDLFRNGEKLVFDTTGHEKAKGVRTKIYYPRTWKAAEGARPHIVQKLVSESGRGMEMVIVEIRALPKQLDRVLTEDEKQEAVSQDVLADLIPPGGRLLSHTVSKLDGETCGMIEYYWVGERAGMRFAEMNLVFVVPMKGALLIIAGVTGEPESSGVDAITQTYAKAKPLFTVIASSCVLPDKWVSGTISAMPSPPGGDSDAEKAIVGIVSVLVLFALAYWGPQSSKPQSAAVHNQAPDSTPSNGASTTPNLTPPPLNQSPPPLKPPPLPDAERRTAFDAVKDLVVRSYRNIGTQRGCAPTAKTSDEKIWEIATLVATAFRQTGQERGERIDALNLNFIVWKFLQIYEDMGDQMVQEHLEYEIAKYRVSGLRPDYRRELSLV